MTKIFLEVLRDDRLVGSHALTDGVLRIGRSSINHVVLPGPAVSKRHAELRVSKQEVELVDLGSTTGTFSADPSGSSPQRIERRSMRRGERYLIGPYALRITAVAPAESSARPASLNATQRSIATDPLAMLADLVDLVGITDQQAILETLLERSMRMIDARTGHVVLVHGGQLSPILASRGKLEGPADYSTTVCQQVIATGRPVVHDASKGAGASESLDGREHEVVVALPLIDEGEVLGVLYMETRKLAEASRMGLMQIIPRVSDIGGRALAAAVDRQQILLESQHWRWLAALVEERPDMVRTSLCPAMQPVLKMIRRSAREDVTVLVRGETGTGKEVTAHTIHRLSRRHEGPFVAVNCSALPADLVEAELFGHERGAFTGATEARPGRFELAQSGTLLLDEVGDLPRDVQVKLLRVLESRTFERLGGRKTLQWTGRLLAATHRDLEAAVARGTFREDLFYRISVVTLTLPPLRERVEDIEPLANEILLLCNRRFQRKLHGVEPAALEAMLAHHWPGNVRELRNVIERAFILEESPQLTAASLPFASTPAPPAPATAAARVDDGPLEPLGEFVARAERQHIERALARSGGNISQAAKALQMARFSLQRKLRQYGLKGGGAGADEDAGDEP